MVEIDRTVASELASLAGDLVQLTREALSNVGRHARAATCRVSLRRAPDGGALLEIDDDGVGFDPATANVGMGLSNVRGRVASLGGELSVTSVDGEGSTLAAHLPIG